MSAFDFNAGNALAFHIGNSEAQIAEDKAFAAGGNESKLIENEAADRGVRGIFGNGDAVLSVEVANIQSSVEDHRTVGESEWFFHDVEFIVNFSDYLFEYVFESDESKKAAEFINDDREAGVAGRPVARPVCG